MTKNIKIASLSLALVIATISTPVFARAIAEESNNPTNTRAAESTKNTNKENNGDAAKIADFKSKADKEIERRIKALNELNTRIQAMKKVTATQKSNLASSIQSQISTLNTLKAKIDADTDLATLKTDVQSITKSYRIFALVIPQGAEIAAADRALTLADQMTTLGTKLQTRISGAKTAGKDVTSLQKSLDDYNAKITDAKTQAQKAIDEISALTPDNGDKAKMEANTKAMKDAKAKIQAAQQDFVAARKDAKDITQGLKAFEKTGDNKQHTAPADNNQ